MDFSRARSNNITLPSIQLHSGLYADCRKPANYLLRFTAGSPEGFVTIDLMEAKALVDELRA